MLTVDLGRRSIGRIATAALLLAGVVATAGAAAAGPSSAADHPVVGRFAIISDAGGAVWAFQPGGALVVIGPGEIISEGTWSAAGGERDFDASLEVTVSGQTLEVLGQVRDDGDAVAVLVNATEPARPDDWTPWPKESRLVGERVGMATEPEPSPTPIPLDCARPAWSGNAVDWDRCDAPIPTGPPG
jgi:hypothetical protein